VDKSLNIEEKNSVYCKYMKINTTKGFTIIELLVVIAIIGLLASVIIASLSTVQAKSRDARRMEDLKEISNALGLYSITNNRYPIAASETALIGTDAVSIALTSGSDKSISAMPNDPIYDASITDYKYWYTSASPGSDYSIRFCLETNSIKNYVKGCTNVISH
jgi:prepilin-type N-terminal cleavage/methylation domain-containing protein